MSVCQHACVSCVCGSYVILTRLSIFLDVLCARVGVCGVELHVNCRLSWDPITVMIAALDVGSVLEKETNYGTQITADPSGAEHFFGTGTKNALTTFAFQDSPEKIAKVIDSYLDAPVHPPPRPSPPPPPPPPTPPAKHVCADPGASPGCSVCAACCHSYIPAGSSCDKCAIEKCTQQ